MKKLFFLVLLSMLVTIGYAQNVDRETVRFLALEFPPKPFVNVGTFSIEMKAPNTTRQHVDKILANSTATRRNELLALKPLNPSVEQYPQITSQYLSINGLGYKPKYGDIVIEYYMEDVEFMGTTMVEIERKCGTKEEPKTCTFYSYQVKYKTSTWYKVKTKAGEELYGRTILNFEDEFSETFGNNAWGNYESAEDLEAGYSKLGSVFYESLNAAVLLQTLIAIGKDIEKTSLHTQTSSREMLTSGKKKFDYENLDEAREKAFRGLEALNGKMPNNVTYSHLKEAITVWESELSGLDASNKKARINASIGAGLYYNIALAHLYMFEFDKALESVKKGKELGKLGSNLKSLERDINDMVKLWEVNGIFDRSLFDEISVPKDQVLGKKKTPKISRIMEIAKDQIAPPDLLATESSDFDWSSYSGEWYGEFNSDKFNASLTIIDPNEFELFVSAGEGSCVGELQGSFTELDNNRAIYRSEDCEGIRFEFMGDHILVTETNCDGYHGLQCGFGMKYSRSWPDQPEPPQTVIIEEVAETPTTALATGAATYTVSSELTSDPDDDSFFNQQRQSVLDSKFNELEKKYYKDVAEIPSSIFYFTWVDADGNQGAVETEAIHNSGYQADPARRGFKWADASIHKRGSMISAGVNMVVPHPFGDGKKYIGHAFPVRVYVSDFEAKWDLSNRYLEGSPEASEEDISGLMYIESAEMKQSTNVFGNPEMVMVLTCRFVATVANKETKEEQVIYGKFASKLK